MSAFQNSTDSDMMDDSQQQTSRPRIVITTKSGAAGASSSSSFTAPTVVRRQIKTKGRGFKDNSDSAQSGQDRYAGKAGEFESIDDEGGADAQKCKGQHRTRGNTTSTGLRRMDENCRGSEIRFQSRDELQMQIQIVCRLRCAWTDMRSYLLCVPVLVSILVCLLFSFFLFLFSFVLFSR